MSQGVMGQGHAWEAKGRHRIPKTSEWGGGAGGRLKLAAAEVQLSKGCSPMIK